MNEQTIIPLATADEALRARAQGCPVCRGALFVTFIEGIWLCCFSCDFFRKYA